MKLLARGFAILALWTVYAFFAASQNFMSRSYSGEMNFTPSLKFAGLDSYLWAALTPVAFLLAGRLVLRRGNWWWAGPLLLVAGIVIGVLHLTVFVRLLPMIGYQTTFRARQTVLVTKLHSDVLTCWTLFAIRHGIEYYRRYRVRELAASQLQAKLAVAQLEVLKMQLQPHFLFNTLNGIATLLRRDPATAEEMLLSLSDLLRIALSSSHRQEIPLREEMDFLGRYLAIQRMRFGDRLRVTEEIETSAMDCLVPALLLQPLVENAIRHGLEPSGKPGELRIAAARDGEWLRLTVEDDGVGLPLCDLNRAGVGLANVRERLAALYGAAHEFSIAERPGGGVVVNIRLPARSEGAAAWRKENSPSQGSPPLPSLSPAQSGGEGGRRPGEGNVHGTENIA